LEDGIAVTGSHVIALAHGYRSFLVDVAPSLNQDLRNTCFFFILLGAEGEESKVSIKNGTKYGLQINGDRVGRTTTRKIRCIIPGRDPGECHMTRGILDRRTDQGFS
jgi:hypothetical protein